LPDTDLAEATNVAERMQNAITALVFAHPIRITVSGGIIQYDGSTVEDMIKLTDEKLYAAKRSGKNRFETSLG
jgi:diguanylate cyclase (GGDEF)-like protein